MKAKLAFYNGKGTFVDKMIRLWTKSDYSHVELVLGHKWYSTSPREGRVRMKEMIPNESSWDYLDVDVDVSKLDAMFASTENMKYDWLGIVFNEILPFKIHSKSRYYCSEWCSEVLGYDPAQMSPEDLYKMVQKVTA